MITFLYLIIYLMAPFFRVFYNYLTGHYYNDPKKSLLQRPWQNVRRDVCWPLRLVMLPPMHSHVFSSGKEGRAGLVEILRMCS